MQPFCRTHIAVSTACTDPLCTAQPASQSPHLFVAVNVGLLPCSALLDLQLGQPCANKACAIDQKGIANGTAVLLIILCTSYCGGTVFGFIPNTPAHCQLSSQPTKAAGLPASPACRTHLK
jgi:hypothetical protein